MLGILSLIASLTLTSLGFPTPYTSTHLRYYTLSLGWAIIGGVSC